MARHQEHGEQLALGLDDDQSEPPAEGEPGQGQDHARHRSDAAAAADVETEPQAEELLEAGQLGLADVPQGRERGRATVPSTVWQQLLDHPPTRASYQAKIYRPDGDGCAYWLGAISDTGHGKLRSRLRINRGLRTAHLQVMTAHVYGYQLANGVIMARLGQDLVIAHRCDETSCQTPAHWELVPRGVNGADYLARRHHAGPLADVRGPHGRAVAIRDAIHAARTTGTDIDQAITAAQAAGLTHSPGLF